MSEMPRIYRAPRIYRSEEFKDTEPTPKVEAFQTERGSIYTYDEGGRTSRHKLATNEDFPTQDLTVFVDMDFEDAQDYLRAAKTSNPRERLYVVEKQSNDGAKKVRHIEEVENKDELYLAICHVDPDVKNDANILELLKAKKVNIQPQEGSWVFDTRRFTDPQNGRGKVENHIGHRVVAIKYSDS